MKNTGARAGEEVVQVYASYEQSKVARPIKQLVGFRRVAIAPGETKTVVIPLESRRIAYWDVARHAFVVEAGQCTAVRGSIIR